MEKLAPGAGVGERAFVKEAEGEGAHVGQGGQGRHGCHVLLQLPCQGEQCVFSLGREENRGT